jgi:hypothetical protein
MSGRKLILLAVLLFCGTWVVAQAGGGAGGAGSAGAGHAGSAPGQATPSSPQTGTPGQPPTGNTGTPPTGNTGQPPTQRVRETRIPTRILIRIPERPTRTIRIIRIRAQLRTARQGLQILGLRIRDRIPVHRIRAQTPVRRVLAPEDRILAAVPLVVLGCKEIKFVTPPIAGPSEGLLFHVCCGACPP